MTKLLTEMEVGMVLERGEVGGGGEGRRKDPLLRLVVDGKFN